MSATACPRLRPALRFIEQKSGSSTVWMVKDPVDGKYYRFGPLEAWIMQQMDGRTTLAQICDALEAEAGVRATPEQLDVLARQLREMGLVERSPTERSALLMEQLRTQRRLRLRQSESTLMRMRFSFGSPNRFFDRCVELAPWFWTRTFVILSLGLFALYGLLLALHWSDFIAALGLIYNPSSLTPGFALAAYAAIVGLVLVHELGHGLTCKRFGGEVHEMGAMLLYFSPAFYCNVNDAWSFERRRDRLWVSFAGGWIELVAATLAAIVWLLTEPGTMVNGIALFVAAFGGGIALLLNYNPLIPLDGYYALLDWLEVPNLRARSFAYTGAVLKRSVLRLDVQVPAVTPRERRIFLRYGILAGVYTTLLLTAVTWFVGGWLVRSFGGWGFAVAAMLVLAMTAGPRRNVARLARVWWAEKRPGRRLQRAALPVGLGALLLLVAAVLTPWTVRATALLELEPRGREYLRAAGNARILDVRVADGRTVATGDTLVVLYDPDLRVEHARVSAAAGELQQRIAAARAAGNLARAAVLADAWESEQRLLHRLERRLNEFVIVAAGAGTLVAPRLHERLGEGVAAGQQLGEVWGDGTLRGRLRLAERDAGTVAPGTRVRVRFPAAPGTSVHGRVEEVERMAAAGFVEATVAFDTLPAGVRAGMRGRARVDILRGSVADATVRAVRRNLRLDLLL